MNWKLNKLGLDFQGQLTTTLALQIFNVLRFIATFFTGVVMVKIGWSTSEVEQYELLMLLFGMVSFFWVSGGQSALLSIIASLDSKDQDASLKRIMFVVCILSFLAGIGVYIIGLYIFQLNKTLLFLLSLYTAFNIPSLFIHLKFLLKDNPKQILVFGLINFGAQFLTVAIPLIIGWNLHGIIKALIVLAVIRYVAFFLIIGVDYKIKVGSLGKRWLLLSLPLAIHMLIGISPEYVDALLIESYINQPGSYAVYKYGARELPVLVGLIGAISTVSIPLLVKKEFEGLQLLKTKVSSLANILFPCSIVLIFIGDFLFEWFYDEAYLVSADIFKIFLLIIITRFWIPHTIIIARNNNYLLVWSGILELVVNVGISFYLINDFGVIGIAIGTVVGNLVQKIFLITVVWSKYQIQPSAYMPVRLLGFWSILLILSFSVEQWMF